MSAQEVDLNELVGELTEAREHATYLDEDVIKPERALHEQTLAERDAFKAALDQRDADLAALVGVDPSADWGDILDSTRQAIAAVLPEYEKQVRERIASNLEAYVDGRAAPGWAKNLQAVARQIAANIRRDGCPLCGGTEVVPGSEDYDSAVHMYNPTTGEPCDCVLWGES